MCIKRGYPNVKRARQAHRRAGFRVRVYRCHGCHQFHVANQDKRRGGQG